MKQFYPLVALAVMLAGGWFFFTNWQVDVTSNSPQLLPRMANNGSQPFAPPSDLTAPLSPAPVSTLPPVAAAPTSQSGGIGDWLNAAGQALKKATTPPIVNSPAPAASAAGMGLGPRDVIRVASFNIQVFGESKISQSDVVNVLATVVRNFDVVAIQEIRSRTQDVLPQFVQAINAAGRRYDYVIGERLGRTSSKEQYAFVFDTDTVEVDRRSLYTVHDPDDLLHREPLVGWFRCRAVDPREAFTFSLVNVHIDPDEVNVRDAMSEINVLDDVFRAVRDDGRGEDDVILLGDFNANEKHFGHIARVPNIAWVVSNTPTNTRGNAQFDNIIFDQQATREFTGRGGVFDFMREYNLSLDQALKVSDHLVVWGEFSVREGGVNGRMASRVGMRTPAPTYNTRAAYSPQQSYTDPRLAREAYNYNGNPYSTGYSAGYSQGYAQEYYQQPPASARTPLPAARGNLRSRTW